MTFVAGFNCANGLVLCADSLEKDGFVKRKVEKLKTYYPTNKWGVCAGGAGPAAILKSFWDKYVNVLGDEPFDLSRFEAKTETCLKAMYKKYPDEQFWFIIGMFSNKEPLTARLYCTEGTCLAPVDKYACIGQDSTLANFILSVLWKTTSGTDECGRLGALVTGLMCDHGDGVERPINIVSYALGSLWAHWPSDFVEQQNPIRELEDTIRDFWKKKSPESM